MQIDSGASGISQLLQQGDRLRQQKAWAEADACYKQAAQLDGASAPAWLGMGLVSEELNDLQRAGDCYRRVLQINEGIALAQFRLGWVLYRQGRYGDALPHYLNAIRLQPSDWLPYNHAAATLQMLRRYDEAIDCYRRALERKQDYADLWYNMGKALKDAGKLDEAGSYYERALALDPNHHKTRFSRGLLHLLQGDWLAGWEGYEQRWLGWDRAGVESPPESDLPRWQGEPVAENSGIVVFSEQGFGDSIHFFRYHALLAQRFARVCFCVQPALVPLFQTNAPPYLTVLPRKADCHSLGMTHHIAMLSLPHAFRTTPDDVPPAPYLHADPARAAVWNQRLEKETRPKIGLVWNGGRVTNVPARDMDFSFLEPLREIDSVCWVCLQKENKPASSFMLDWMDEAKDFADTAALIASLDLVIAVDTAVAHLAGALGKPVWLLNRFESEWRWMHGRTDTPWYPAMRIFSQPAPGAWDKVIADVKRAVLESMA